MSEAPGGNLIAAAGEAQLMAPIVHAAAADLRDIATSLASCSTTGAASADRSALPYSGNSKSSGSGFVIDDDPIVDGSVVVTSGAPGGKSPSSAAEAALKAVSLTSAIPSAARRKGRKDRPRVTAAAAAPTSGADEHDGLFDDSTLEFLVDDAARLLASKAPACHLEAPEPGPEERGYVVRAPIFLWKI